jgi:predicted transcriptional regulator
VAKLEKSVRIAGQSRTQLAADLKTQYEQGASIRELARATGRSYGFIHAVLTEAQVSLRGRGLPGTARSAPQPS